MVNSAGTMHFPNGLRAVTQNRLVTRTDMMKGANVETMPYYSPKNIITGGRFPADFPNLLPNWLSTPFYTTASFHGRDKRDGSSMAILKGG